MHYLVFTYFFWMMKRQSNSSARVCTALTGLFLIFCAGCATLEPVASETSDEPTLRDVQQRGDAYTGRSVRWGGTVLARAQLADGSAASDHLLVLARPLDKAGKPRLYDDYRGRFLVRLPQPGDAGRYARGASITVQGRLLPRRLVAQDYYALAPLVEAEQHTLWPGTSPHMFSYGGYRYHSPVRVGLSYGRGLVAGGRGGVHLGLSLNPLLDFFFGR